MLGAGDLPVTADMETTGGQSAAAIAANLQTWASAVAAGTGKKPMIYTAIGYWDSDVLSSAFSSDPLWVADWGPSCPDLPSEWSGWSFWQYSDSGSVSGIGGAVDLDEFNGSLADLQSFTGPTPPRGYLDGADCTTVTGWTQDTDVPTQSIFADVYFNGSAGSAGATGIRLDADVARSDLCTAIGSCDHGFSMSTPRSTFDGASHDVYAYGINPTSGGANTLLTNSPRTFTCSPPAIASGSVKRHVTSPTIFSDWQFDSFTDVAPYSTSAVAAVPDDADLGASPSLVQVSGQSAVYIADGVFYRHVTDPTSFSAWRFASSAVHAITAAQLAAMTQGPDWPAAPLLVKDPTAAPVYLLDVPLPSADDAGLPDAGSKDAGAHPHDASTDATRQPADATAGHSSSSRSSSASSSSRDAGSNRKTPNGDAGMTEDASSIDGSFGDAAGSASGCSVARAPQARVPWYAALLGLAAVASRLRRRRRG
jgi:hypothetical protein